ncbi:MAG: hypothetical protein AVDCRST_MAG55-3327 [uncultured Rubrobacteraceae bacterium]|uniref:Uncharacterized protein n=1 Tax=uncultured Rubrobacteraceae bacterium TaxID=349277 RepID=A0A6J4QG56_9ACTN|nr:MAG: hypothetical protein AVDCRST_MAG55-3327 [uncultured Rubrobacteraceae bacterium]
MALLFAFIGGPPWELLALILRSIWVTRVSRSLWVFSAERPSSLLKIFATNSSLGRGYL